MTTQGTQERELPMLAGIGAFVTWCEDLLAILSGPILTAGLAIALVALLTDGQLLVSVPALLWVWAVSQAIGLDAQFIGAAAKLARAVRARRVWPIIGYALLCTALGYVGYLASNVFATQEANGITTAEALARLGMDSTSWIVQRSALAVGLVFLSGFLRYVAPAPDVAADTEQEKAQLQAELELEPLRAQKRAMQARGWRDVGAAVLGKETSHEPTMNDTNPTPQTVGFSSGEATGASTANEVGRNPSSDTEQPPERPPTGPGSPARKRGVRTQAAPAAPNIVQLPATPPRRRRRKKAAQARGRTTASVEAKARTAWRPGMSVGALQAAAGISKGSAQKYHAKLTALGVAATLQSPAEQPDQGQQKAAQ